MVDFVVEVFDELLCLFGRDCALTGRLDERLLLKYTKRVANLVVGVARFVRHLHDTDRFILDNHPQNLQMAFQHVDFLLQSIYHGNC